MEKGTYLTSFKYDYCGKFENGWAYFKIGRKGGEIHTSKEVIWN